MTDSGCNPDAGFYNNNSLASTEDRSSNDSHPDPSVKPVAIYGLASRSDYGSETRYNVAGYHWPTKKPGHTITKHGYFLDPDVDIGALDTSVFPMARGELEVLDPQQRLLMEVPRESRRCWGSELAGDESLNEACVAIGKGDCSSAIVAGTSIIMAPSLTTDMSDQGTLSPDGSCNPFYTKANGYARGEGIVALFVKSLDDALRDGNPIRSVIVGSATNGDGNTPCS
ncbi:unnamed protein product [Clonostachys rosea f. rosea IK726]|uniref:Uncharacterized protein n=1 Tax=Clonostachys rosea f. rosea IK726 TaxID=1349383 RepID=A0ACA9U7V4_BIOOC|nr:unnamed protein product [Clonostachys rosea f. rosea IK726]